MKTKQYLFFLSILLISLIVFASCSKDDLNHQLDNTGWIERVSQASSRLYGLSFSGGYMHKLEFDK